MQLSRHLAAGSAVVTAHLALPLPYRLDSLRPVVNPILPGKPDYISELTGGFQIQPSRT